MRKTAAQSTAPGAVPKAPAAPPLAPISSLAAVPAPAASSPASPSTPSTPTAASSAIPTTVAAVASASYLLVRAGDYVCGLPLPSVRRVMRALAVHPLPGAALELKGLAEFAGEPLPILDLAQLVGAPAGATPLYPVTIVAWAGPPESRESVGLAAEAALEVVVVAHSALVAGDGGFVVGEASVGGRVVRMLNLEALGRR